MSYAVDLAFVDAAGGVLAVQTLRPWRLSRHVAAAYGVVELRSGEIERLGLTPGDQIEAI